MSMFDELKDKALDLAKEHKDVVENAAEQAAAKLGDVVDSATGGKFSDQIDSASKGASEQVAGFLEQA